MSRSTRLLALALAFATACGCNKQDPNDPKVVVEQGNNVPGDPVTVGSAPPSQFAHLHKPFKEAVLPEAPEDQQRPPDKTITGKSVPRLYEQIAGVEGRGGVWDEIRFVTPGGKRIRYRATIRTDAGNIELEFFPDQAPNHVRSFLALAKVGYFDGLAIDQILNTTIDDSPWTYMVAGCPLGTGEPGYGSIGYWLFPEIGETLKHDVGTVGTWHGETVESGACKFYITLTKAPWLDGNYTIFAKISQGLDVARKISERPVQEEDNRPKEPVIIREVILHQSIEDPPV